MQGLTVNAEALNPPPSNREPFRLTSVRFVPDSSGCYLLTNFKGEILYIGKTECLSRRLQNHLSSKDKLIETSKGSAIFFHWTGPVEFPELLENSWLSQYEAREGNLPPMNKVRASMSRL